MRALVIIARQGFQDKELEGTVAGLTGKNFEVSLASTEAGPCTGKFGSTQQARLALKDVMVNDYDRIAFIGGPGAAALADDGEAQRIAKNTVKAGKVLGAICIAPTIFAKAGVLQGKKATVWNEDGEQENMLRKHGAEYTGEAVTVDGRIITANGPAAAGEFGRRLASL